jgi:hypothetical protein
MKYFWSEIVTPAHLEIDKWQSRKGNGKKKAKTYNSRYSLVVTHPTTNLPI